MNSSCFLDHLSGAMPSAAAEFGGFGVGKDAAGEAEKAGDGLGGHGASEEKTLAEAASHLAQETILIAGLDAFGYDIHAQHTGEFDDGADDLARLFSLGHAPDEGAVDFEHIEGEGVEVAEGTIAGAEVVHEEGDAEFA
jgi:hypothetical protein